MVVEVANVHSGVDGSSCRAGGERRTRWVVVGRRQEGSR